MQARNFLFKQAYNPSSLKLYRDKNATLRKFLRNIGWGLIRNVVDLSFIVRHSREGGNLFVFKYINWIPAFAGMTIKTACVPAFLNSKASGLILHRDLLEEGR